MATKREIIYDIMERIKVNSDDMDITEEYLSHLINVKRALLIKQRFNDKLKSIPINLTQELCLELELIDNIEGESCLGQILRTKDKIPKLIDLSGKDTLLSIKTYDRKHIPFNLIPIERMPFVGNNRWLAGMIYVALDSDMRLYFMSNKDSHRLLEMIKAAGVFEDPEDATELMCEQPDNSDEPCDPLDREFPMEDYMISDLVNMIIKELLPTIQMPKDNKNDSDGDRQ